MMKRILLCAICAVFILGLTGLAIAAPDVIKSPTEELIPTQQVLSGTIGQYTPKAEMYPAVLTTDGKEKAKTIKAAVQKEGTEKEAYKAVQKEEVVFTIVDETQIPKLAETDTGPTIGSSVIMVKARYDGDVSGIIQAAKHYQIRYAMAYGPGTQHTLTC